VTSGGHWHADDGGLRSAQQQEVASWTLTGVDPGPSISAAADAVAAPLDLLLTDAAIGPLRRVNPGGAGLRLAAALARRPRLVAGRGRELLGELGRVAAGTSTVQPSRRDRRFADPGWTGNPVLRRAMQAYLAAAHTAEGLAGDAELDWGRRGASWFRAA